jgi:hypothetical protein
MLEFGRMLEKQNKDLINKYFESTSRRPIISKSSAMSMKKEAIPSKSIISQRTSLATKKHEKHKKTTRLDFSSAQGVIHLSNDYHNIHRELEIKHLQATKEGCMAFQNRLNRLLSALSPLN